MNILGDIERLAADIYPLRIPIAIGMALLTVAALIAAYRLGWYRVVLRHKVASSVVAGLALLLLVPTVYYLASPLVTRTTLVEPMPASATESLARSAEPSGGTGPAGARVIQQGEFKGADSFHFGRGRALVAESEPGRYVLRLEDFSVRNGPDLFVYLSPNPSGYAADAINLGALKATDGAFSYDIPAGTDISKLKSAIIWCRQFSVLFATATLV